MTAVYIFDAPEFRPVADTGAALPGVQKRQVGLYLELSADGPIVIDRRATGVPHGVWYSAVAGVAGGTVTQYDKEALRVEPV
jgi:hypothetical protein